MSMYMCVCLGGGGFACIGGTKHKQTLWSLMRPRDHVSPVHLGDFSKRGLEDVYVIGVFSCCVRSPSTPPSSNPPTLRCFIYRNRRGWPGRDLSGKKQQAFCLPNTNTWIFFIFAGLRVAWRRAVRQHPCKPHAFIFIASWLKRGQEVRRCCRL